MTATIATTRMATQPKLRSNAGENAVRQVGAGPKPRGGTGDHQVNRANTGENAYYSEKNDRRDSHTLNVNVHASQMEEYERHLLRTFHRIWLGATYGCIQQHLLQDCRVTAFCGGDISSISTALRSVTKMSTFVDVVCLDLGSVDVL